VDLIQGYLFGIPLPSRDLAELIQRMAHSAEQNVAKRAFG
jgi:EAL domain-containing protein (putative c-di-GMP-specific phosphodiesterase class I)